MTSDKRNAWEQWKWHHDEAWPLIKIFAVIFIIATPLSYIAWESVNENNLEFRTNIESLSCPEIMFLIQYADFEHHGNETVLDVYVDRCT